MGLLEVLAGKCLAQFIDAGPCILAAEAGSVEVCQEAVSQKFTTREGCL